MSHWLEAFGAPTDTAPAVKLPCPHRASFAQVRTSNLPAHGPENQERFR